MKSEVLPMSVYKQRLEGACGSENVSPRIPKQETNTFM